MATDIMATSTTELVASSVGAGSFRSQLSSLASLEEDENTRFYPAK